MSASSSFAVAGGGPCICAPIATLSAKRCGAAVSATHAASATTALNCGSPCVVMSSRRGPKRVMQMVSPRFSCSSDMIAAQPPSIQYVFAFTGTFTSQPPCCVSSSTCPLFATASLLKYNGRLILFRLMSVNEITCRECQMW